MAQKTINARISLRADTAAKFASANPVLLKNELAIEKDTGKKKLGDGTSKYNTLPYLEKTEWSEIQNIPSSFTPAEHTHNYAGSSSAGGAATSADKLNTDAGSATQPVYFKNGIPIKTTYTLNTSVPADAKFTDTIYTHPSTHAASMITGLADVAISGTYADLTGVPESLPADGGNADTVSGFTVGTNVPANAKFTDTTYSAASASTAGLMSAEDKAKLDGIAEGANNYIYTLPNATSSTLGGVKVGTNISVSNGTISVANSSTSAKGVVQLTNSTSSTSTTTAATPASVKSAYDLAKSKQSPATSLSGYGITDAYTKDEVNTLCSNNSVGELSFLENEWIESSGEYTITKDLGAAKVIGIYKKNGSTEYQVVEADKISISSGGTLTICSPSAFDGFVLLTSSVAFDSDVTEAISAIIDGKIEESISANIGDKVSVAIEAEMAAHNNSNTSHSEIRSMISDLNVNKADFDHSHDYAGSLSAGGAAISANKLNTNAGSTTQPVYFKDGIPTKTAYTLSADVPSDAKFTDTIYVHPDTHSASMITGLANVATSGAYADLSGIPTSLKNPTSLTLQNSSGTSIGSYDGSTAKTIKLTASTVGLGNVTNESKATMFTSAALTGTPTAPTASATTNSTQIATTAFVNTVVNNKIAAADAMIYKGTIGTGGTVTSLPNTHSTGWTYKVITAGTYAGMACNVGDMIICLTDGTAANNSHWTVIEGNIDGAVIGPVSSVNAHVAVFDGATGKVIKDSGYTIASSVPSNAKFTDTIYSLPNATSSTLGGVKVGTNINVSSGTISVANGSTSAKGVVQLSSATNSTSTSLAATASAVKAAYDLANGKVSHSDLADVATSGSYSDLSDKPTSLPANGGNAATVGGFTVSTNVPADAKFTDTVYTLPNATSSALGGVKIGTNISVSNGTISVANGSTSAKGIVQLSSATNSTSTSLAATASAVKAAYDLANKKQSPSTTIAGYGITDAYTKTEINNKFSTANEFVVAVITE